MQLTQLLLFLSLFFYLSLPKTKSQNPKNCLVDFNVISSAVYIYNVAIYGYYF